MYINPELVQDICRNVINEGVAALRAQRVNRRQLHLMEPEVLTVDQAELHDLNRIIFSVIEDVMPLCESLGVPLQLDMDPRVPAVPMLARPIQDALAAALDLCLECENAILHVRTQVLRNRAVATVQHCAASRTLPDIRDDGSGEWPIAPGWHAAGTLDPVELIIGDRATRALGGRLLLHRAGDEMRLWLELPTNERPIQGWQVDSREPNRPSALEESLNLPGTPWVPVIGSPQSELLA